MLYAPSCVFFSVLLTLNDLFLSRQYSIHQPPKGSVGYYQKIVAELDSALNQWMDSVPDHRTCV